MKKNVMYCFLLILILSFCSGCSQTPGKEKNSDSESGILDKVVFEKNKENVTEVMSVYFKGENVTKVEVREKYSNEEAALRAYETYNNSTIYTNLNNYGLNIDYEYTRIYKDKLFGDFSDKKNIIDNCEKNMGYIKK